MAVKKSSLRLSVIVVFFDMTREAKRTLYSLSCHYQRNVNKELWEVIAIDNGSSQALDEQEVTQFGDNFRYIYFDTHTVSPVQAINYGVEQAHGDLVSVCIDGARMFSPGIIRGTLDCFAAFDNPFVCTLAWHLGSELQNISMMKGYCQTVEDELLGQSDWQKDGYNLFNISSLAGSSMLGYFAPISESNFFTLRKTTFEQENGYEIRFTAPWSGAANPDFYKRIAELKTVQTIHLLGEGTFHQFHGGVATNVSMSEHPQEYNRAQYQAIRGEKFTIAKIQPISMGRMPATVKRFIATDC